MRTRAPLALAFIILLASAARATDYGVFVDGSYSSGRESAGDRLVDRRIDEAKRIFDNRHNDPDDQSVRVDTRQGFENALSNIHCHCGDTLTIVMAGHGENDRFIFSKEANRNNRRLSAERLRELLGGATAECCCKIHIVIFACHSGSMIDDLMQDPHVESIYTSCAGSEQSQSYQEVNNGTIVDNGDWIQFFNEDWDAVPAGASVADQMEAAAKSAKEKLPPGGTGGRIPMHPQGRRRNVPVLGHVESVRKRSGKVTEIQVHFYEPESLRCTTEWVKLAAGATAPLTLAHCNWIRFAGVFGGPGVQVVAEGTVELTAPPTEQIIAHVEAVNRSASEVTIHTIEPKWMYCTRRKLVVEPPGQIGEGIRRCRWIEQEISVTDPDPRGSVSTSGDVEPSSRTFNVKANVHYIMDLAVGTAQVKLLAPPFLYGEERVIQVAAEEQHKLMLLYPGDNIWMDYDTEETAEGFQPASNLVKAFRQEVYVTSHMMDAGIDLVLQPPQSTEVNKPVNPEVIVRNTGQADLSMLCVSCTMSFMGEPFYTEIQQTDALPAGSSAGLTFEPWLPAQTGTYTLQFHLEQLDDNPANDTVTQTVTVVPPSTWPTAADANLDGRVNILDLITIRNKINQSPSTGDNWRCDVNDDGAINILDLIYARNRIGNNSKTTPPFTRQMSWQANGTLQLPPGFEPPLLPVAMHGYATWLFNPAAAPGYAQLVLQDFSGAAEPLVIFGDLNGDGLIEVIDTGEIVFDIHDVDTALSGGSVNLGTKTFSSTLVVAPRAPALDDMGIVLFDDPVMIVESGAFNSDYSTFNASGNFSINSGPLAGGLCFFGKGGKTTTTTKLSSNKYWVDVRAAFTLLWLKNLSVPDGKVKVKAKVKINGREVVVEGELEIKDGKSTEGLKIGGLGELVTVQSVEIEY